MTVRPGHLTAREIAANNRRERQDLAARLDRERAVAGGPFDEDTDLDAPPDETPPVDELLAELAENRPVIPVVEDLRARLAAAAAPTGDAQADRFAATAHPRVVDGLVIPALSVADYLAAVHGGRGGPAGEMYLYGWRLGQRAPARPEYVRVGQLGAIHTATRAIGSYLPAGGQWLPLWVGPDETERDLALRVLLAALADWETRIRR